METSTWFALNGGGQDSTKERTILCKCKSNNLAFFLAGVGAGIAAAVLLVPESGAKTRSRIRDLTSRAGDALKDGAENLADSTGEVLEDGKHAWRNEQEQGDRLMSDMKDKAKQKIDYAADAVKKAAGQVSDKTKDLAHNAGEKMEEAGKRIQKA